MKTLKNRRKQMGYTLTELLIVLYVMGVMALSVAVPAGIIWVLWHFLSKFW